MATVFISYARPDRQKVSVIAAELEAAGYEVWWDRQVAGGEEFTAVIEQELQAAQLVLVCWSADGIVSKWVRDEATVGAEQDKLVALSLDGSMPPLGFRQYHCLDVDPEAGNPGPSMAELLASIAVRLGQPPTRPSPPATAPAQTAAGSGQKRFILSAALMVSIVVAVVALRTGSDDAAERSANERSSVSDTAATPPTAEDPASAAELAAVGTTSQEAYQLYGDARQLLNKRGLFLRGAIEKFGQATALDPQLARAYAGLSVAHLVSSNYLRTQPALSRKRARSNAEKAMELDPTLAEPLAVLGWIELEDNHWQASMDLFSKALELEPDNTTALQWKSEALMYLGYFQQAVELSERALEVDPESAVLELIMGNAYWAMHDLESAQFHFRRSENLGGLTAVLNRAAIDLERGRTLSASLDFAEHLFAFEFITEAEVRPFAQFLLDAINHSVAVDDRVSEFPAPASDSDFVIVLRLFAGETEKALKAIEADVDRDKDTFVKIWSDIQPAPRHHPYFKIFVRNTGMLDYWLANGWPDVCRPLADDDFVCN